MGSVLRVGEAVAKPVARVAEHFHAKAMTAPPNIDKMVAAHLRATAAAPLQKVPIQTADIAGSGVLFRTRKGFRPPLPVLNSLTITKGSINRAVHPPTGRRY